MPYHNVRFRWWTPFDLDEAMAVLGEKFQVTVMNYPKNGHEISFYQKERGELKVSANTLSVMVSPFRAVLYQREVKAFTKLDVELREKIIRIYTKSTPTPFPWGGLSEPKFEIEKEKE